MAVVLLSVLDGSSALLSADCEVKTGWPARTKKLLADFRVISFYNVWFLTHASSNEVNETSVHKTV